MACTPMNVGGLQVIVCSRGTKRERCQVPGCSRWCVALCDYELSVPLARGVRPGTSEKTRSAVKDLNTPKTCDIRLCAVHKWAIPGSEDRDLCPAHAKMHKAKAAATTSAGHSRGILGAISQRALAGMLPGDDE